MPTRPTPARLAAVAAAAVLGLGVAACGDDSADTAPPAAAPAEVPTEQPGGGATVDAEHSEADVEFAQAMLVHHEGAVEMAQLAPGSTEDPEVLDLASRIEAAQQPEMELMRGWLQAWGAEMGGTDPHGAHGDHSSMPGMTTPEQMTQLREATGAEFDRMFLEMMVEHHEGAVEMAETQLREGTNPQALALAEQIGTSQTAEIEEMRQLLAARG
ncbi:DUF305 domain-containing protein [Kineococcus sp. SYSU DK004]|uniref:DUF305 domain-containing protein n=1 Tax=Kineococcus sp. SYSU DK004 TaxID=3383125 RepID=UPI003D7F0EED